MTQPNRPNVVPIYEAVDRAMSDKRQSIQGTYDSRDTGTRYHVTTWIGDHAIAFRSMTRSSAQQCASDGPTCCAP